MQDGAGVGVSMLMVLWFYGLMVFWLWYYAIMVLWYSGILVLWLYGVVVSWFQKLPNCHFVFFDRYGSHIQDFKILLRGFASFVGARLFQNRKCVGSPEFKN